MADLLPRGLRNTVNRLSHVPIIGPHIGRVGRVISIASNPCSPSPEILVFAAFAAIPTILWTFVKPSPIDFLGEKFLNTARSKKKFKFTIWAQTHSAPNPDGAAHWFAFRGIELARRIGWYFTVADATSGGLLNWVSTAYRWAGCTDTAHGGGYAQMTGTSTGVELLPAVTKIYTFWSPDANFGMGVGPAGIAAPSNMIASVSFGLNSRKNDFGLPDANYSVYLTRGGFGNISSATQVPGSINGTKINQGFFGNGIAISKAASRAEANGSYQVVIDKEFGAIQWDGGFMSATGSPLSDAISPDP